MVKKIDKKKVIFLTKCENNHYICSESVIIYG